VTFPLLWLSTSSHDDDERTSSGSVRQRARAASASSGTLPVDHPDFDLVHHVRAGDQVALGEIFLARYLALVAFSRAIVHDSEVAEDVVTGVFARIWERRSVWMPVHGVAAYLFGAVRKESYRVLRAGRVRAAIAKYVVGTGDPPPGMSNVAEGPDVAVDQADRDAAIWRAIDRLPSARREILYLRWHERLRWEEIAAVTETTVVAIKRQHSRALAMLRERLPRALH
jgi:RNA polymerase sigma factor (sigma-70 family)